MTRRAFFEHSMAGIDYLKLSIGSDAVSTLVDRFSDNNAPVVAFKVGLGIVIDADVHCAQQRQHIQDTVRHY